MSPVFGTAVPLALAQLTGESVGGGRKHAECLDSQGLEAAFQGAEGALTGLACCVMSVRTRFA